MCVSSVIGDQFRDQFPQRHPGIHHWVQTGILSGPTRAEFDALKAEIAELKKLLIAAKRYDEATGQPDCEQDDKIALIKKLAALVGIDLADVFPNVAHVEEGQ